MAVCAQGTPRCEHGQQRVRMEGSAPQSPRHAPSTTSPMADADSEHFSVALTCLCCVRAGTGPLSAGKMSYSASQVSVHSPARTSKL